MRPLRQVWVRWRSERGSVAIEVMLLAPCLVMLLVFVGVVIHRGVDARLRLNDVAHQATRAASMERTAPAATAAAQNMASSALSAAGVVCQTFDVATDTGRLVPGGLVTVTVTCSVDLTDAHILAVPSRMTLSATASEPVDTWRSGAVNAMGAGG